MVVMKGKYNIAKIMLSEEDIDEATKNEIQNFLNHPALGNSSIRIMPDAHATNHGVVIGFTMTMNDYILSSLVGVDIGCGVLTYNLGKVDVDLPELDIFVRENIPSGFGINHHKDPFVWVDERMSELYQYSNHFTKNISEIAKKINPVKENDFFNAIGSIGSGNHFYEFGADDTGNKWLTVHSGSRNFGFQVANYYQKKAIELNKKFFRDEKDLAFLPMEYGGKEYLEDMAVAQKYASLNRRVMIQRVVEGFFKEKYEEKYIIESVHNYIDLDKKIIRKGAISAQEGEKVIIPFNMRDGMMIGKGKGNKDWNFSAPHGAGRSMSRKQAKNELTMDAFTKSMEGIYTTSAVVATLDEAPMAYKPMDLILKNIGETVEPITFVKPLWNFKNKDAED